MNDAKSANRLRLAILLAIGLFFAAGSYWLLEVVRKNARDAGSTTRPNKPDYFVEQFNFVRLSKTGAVRYNVSGAKLSHLVQDDSYLIEKPVIHSLPLNQAPITSYADTAHIDHARSKLQLIGNVIIERPASEQGANVRVSTDYLVLLPDEDLARTDKPVVIRVGASVVSGIGMTANNATGEFRLLSNVRAVIPHAAIQQ
ncbi:MAG: LPS export ABC transporter periplasmic protein LptC [Pseudomonadota bacterium]